MAKNSLGQRLRDIREAKGMTQEEVAAKAKMKYQAVARLELGGTLNPRIDTVRALAKALGVSVSELIE